MRKQKVFDSLGVEYRITQMSAIEGMARLDGPSLNDDPLGTLAVAQAAAYDEQAACWVPLDTTATVDSMVRDARDLGPYAPRTRPDACLAEVLAVIADHNFAFASRMDFVKFPPHLLGERIDWEAPKGTNSIIVSLIAENKATLEKLQTYYSVEDAYYIYNAMAAASLRNALSHEAAEEAAKVKAKRG